VLKTSCSNQFTLTRPSLLFTWQVHSGPPVRPGASYTVYSGMAKTMVCVFHDPMKLVEHLTIAVLAYARVSYPPQC
jgi:hypothetical protein